MPFALRERSENRRARGGENGELASALCGSAASAAGMEYLGDKKRGSLKLTEVDLTWRGLRTYIVGGRLGSRRKRGKMRSGAGAENQRGATFTTPIGEES